MATLVGPVCPPVASHPYRNCNPRHRVLARNICFVFLSLLPSAFAIGQSKAATNTALTVTSGGLTVSSISSGTVVTLKATVTSGGSAVTPGQVTFCDASASFCTDIHVLGTAQVASGGTAAIHIRPSLGSHTFKAIFSGTNSYAGSSSSASTLAVTGSVAPIASSTTIGETGSWGSYALTGTVTEVGGTAAPTGTVSFLDSSHGNAILGQGSLGASTAGTGWLTKQSSWAAAISGIVADFNGDGNQDIAEADSSGQIDILLGNGDGTFSLLGTKLTPSSANGNSLAAGDFNDDGIPDLVVVSPYYNSATVYLGKGDGTFVAVAAQPNVGQQPGRIAVADFNGDGNLDLAITNAQYSANSTVTILLGNGDGSFTPASSSPSAGIGAYAIVAADFNGDGKADLAVTTQQTTSLTILLGNGDGTFTPAASPQVTSYASAVAAADFNADGKLDLIVACGNGGLVFVLLGNGDGTFTAAPSFPAPVSNPNGVVVGDFNLDGIVDVGFLNYDYTKGGPLEFLGNGDGTFTQLPGLPTLSMYSGFLAGGDFNGDGRTDIAISGSGSGSQNLVTYLSEPTETATATANLAISGVGQHLVNASYAGNANYTSSVSAPTPLWGVTPATSTVLTLTSGGSNVTSVAPGTLVTLTATVTVGSSPISSGQVNFCDASAIYCSDIHLLAGVAVSSNGAATFKFVPGPGSHSYKAVFVENGYGLSSSSNPVSLTVGPAPKPVYSDTTAISASGVPGNYSLTATVVGYGGSASVTGNASFLDTSFGNTTLGTAPLGSSVAGTGWIISQTPALSNAPLAEVAADFNQDGLPDLALLWSSTQSGGPYSITMLTGKGNGSFTTGSTFSTGIGSQTDLRMISGDFNGDGKPDLAILSWNISNNTSYVTILLSNGDGTFAAPTTSVAYAQGLIGGDGVPGSIAAADFNGDGKLDIAVVGDYVSAGGAAILLGNGDGTFKATTNLTPIKDFGQIATGDFNGDGIPDLVVTNYFEFGSSPTIFLGKGDGTFVAKTASFTLAYFPTSIVVGDFNGDGLLDLAFADLNGVEIALGNGDGTFKETAASPIAVPSELYSLTVGDFNRDGKLDLAGLDNYNDRIVLLNGAGDGTFTVTATTPAVSQDWLGPFAMVAADFNEDGVPDLAMLTKNQTTASVLIDEPTETATATLNHVAPIGLATHAVEASYSGDSNYPLSISSTINLDAGLAPLTISPPAGSYSTVQTVTLNESVPGATIYYRTYGVMNTSGFVPYTGPITLSQGGNVTILAYATETGYVQSSYLDATYNLNFPVTPTPTLSPGGGYYAGAQSVTITDPDPSAKIYYTTNGIIPTSASKLYTGPITVNASETIVAVALSYGASLSAPVTTQYVIGSSSTPLIYSVAGTGVPGYSGDGGPATLAQIEGSGGIVKDAAGNVYFSDAVNHMVRKIASGTGIISVVAGNGYFASGGDGGPASSASLEYPESLALDGSTLYIADVGSENIRKVDLTTGTISTFAGNGTCSGNGDGGPALAAVTCNTASLAVDSSHNLYISNYSSIRQVNAPTGIITTIAGNSYGYSGDGGPASAAGFRGPAGLAFDPAGNLYIADANNQLIRKITAVNGVITGSSIISTVAGTPPQPNTYPAGGYSGDGGPATSATFNNPVAIAFDASGNLFIADEYNKVIREVAASTGTVSTVVGNGTCGLANGDGGAATSASVCFPSVVMIDVSGNIFIADWSERIREVVAAATPPSTPAAAPALSLPAGNYQTPQTLTITGTTPRSSIYVTVDGSTPSPASSPGYSVPFDVTGQITVKAVALAPGYLPSAPVSATYSVSAFAPLITTIAGNGIQGISTSGTPAQNLEFGGAYGVAVDQTGNLYIADALGCAIWVVPASSGTGSIYAGTGTCGFSGDGGPATSATFYNPQALAFDSTGNLYIADQLNGVIRKITTSTGIISTVAGNRSISPTNLGDGGPAISAYLNGPAAIAFDSAGNLYIADSGDNRIREVSANTSIITTVAGNGSFNASGDGGPATSAGIQRPDSLAVDAVGNIYIGSTNSSRIRKVTAATGKIDSIAGFKDLRGDIGDGGLATAAEVAPRALALDRNGNLYISNDPGEIRMIDPTTGVISRVAGIGFPGYSGDNGAATAAEIYYPNQIAFDPTGNLIYADTMGRIRKLTLVSQPAAAPVFSPAGGTYTSAQTVTISDATTGATIHYTTDGSMPTAASAVYSAPIPVNATQTIQAIAVAIGFSQSSVASATYTINLPPPTFNITATSVTISKGATGGNTSTVTVQPSNGFTGNVTLTASLTSSPAGAQYPPTFSFGATSPVAVSGSAGGVATLTISTTAATVAINRSGSSLWISGTGFTMALTVFFCLPARRRKWKNLTLTLFAVLVLSSVSACGGGNGGSGGSGGGGGIAGTTPGSYVITVTGTSGSLTQTGVINLTVK